MNPSEYDKLKVENEALKIEIANAQNSIQKFIVRVGFWKKCSIVMFIMLCLIFLICKSVN